MSQRVTMAARVVRYLLAADERKMVVTKKNPKNIKLNICMISNQSL